jgi:hypothetical protein
MLSFMIVLRCRRDGGAAGKGWPGQRRRGRQLQAGGCATSGGQLGSGGLAIVGQVRIAFLPGRAGRGNLAHGALGHGGNGQAGVDAEVGGYDGAVGDVEAGVVEDFMVGVDHAIFVAGADAAAAEDVRRRRAC